MRRMLLLALLLAPGVWPEQRSAEPAAGEVIVISGGTLIDGTGAEPVRDSVVVIEGDRIKAAGPRAALKLPRKVDRRIDAKGQ
jgi:cytosine/adenosine deaminase-related metal-dependent hydrolase